MEEEPTTRLSALDWGVAYLCSKGWTAQDGYSPTWAEDAEAAGYFCWVFEFLGSNKNYDMLERWHSMLNEMFGANGWMVEVGDSLARIVFDSPADAIMFKFKVVDEMA